MSNGKPSPPLLLSGMAKTQYPYVTSWRDRHGKTRYRFRRKGFITHHFKTSFGSRDFEAEYEWAKGRKADDPEPPPVIGYRTASSGLNGLPLVYFIGPTYGPVKIGKTINLAERMKKLQTGFPKRLNLLAVMPGGAEEEAAIHARFAEERLEGEWFRRSGELAALMKANRPHQWRTDLSNDLANQK